MISLTFPSKRPQPVPVLEKTWYNSPQDLMSLGITSQEYSRRDSIIKNLCTEFGLAVGDTCYPTTKDGYKQYDGCLIQYICKSYKDFGKEPWPKNDNPMIVTFSPIKDPSTTVFCTTNYLSKKNTHMNVCS